MNAPVQTAQSDEVPDIVPIVLQQAFKFVSLGRIDGQTYQEQLERLEREELQPKGLSLSMETRPDGGTRFLVRRCKSGDVCTALDCRPVYGEETVSVSGRNLPPASAVFPGAPPAGIQPAC